MTWLEVDGPSRSDWLRTRGRNIHIRLGPFWLYVDTADAGQIGFAVQLGRWSWAWTLLGDEYVTWSKEAPRGD